VFVLSATFSCSLVPNASSLPTLRTPTRVGGNRQGCHGGGLNPDGGCVIDAGAKSPAVAVGSAVAEVTEVLAEPVHQALKLFQLYADLLAYATHDLKHRCSPPPTCRLDEK
jgi:hypothetical protein